MFYCFNVDKWEIKVKEILLLWNATKSQTIKWEAITPSEVSWMATTPGNEKENATDLYKELGTM